MGARTEHLDVLIVGAGLSGIGGAYYLQKMCPTKTYAILETRSRIGGTWDLFRYPGIRSDSDMHTMGFAFKPWIGDEAISPGPAIRDYVEETAKDFGIDKHIRFNHKVLNASWSSQEKCWTLEVARLNESGEQQEVVRFTCQFIFACSGYYKYDAGYTPDFVGREKFKGTIVHPNQWPESLDYANKRVVVIGSGATAVTLVPNLAKTASHVTMLQRSPTYIVSFPSQDFIANFLRRILPSRLAYFLTRWKNIGLMTLVYRKSRRSPEWTRAFIAKLQQKALGDAYAAKDFTPRYNPWEQRMCLIPNGDLYTALKERRASIETDEIETFTEHGLKLKSGKELEADIIVTATGFNMQLLGGIELTVDGKPVDLTKAVTYKGVLYSDIPNLFAIFGYINASWTLKVDVFFSYVCRLLNKMEKAGALQVTARRPEGDDATTPFVENFSSGYMQRGNQQSPRQGLSEPWRMQQNYLRDIRILKYGNIEDDALEFSPTKRT